MKLRSTHWPSLLVILLFGCYAPPKGDDDDPAPASDRAPAGETPLLTCAELVACYGECQDLGCQRACRSDAGPQAREQWAMLTACIQRSGCEGVETCRSQCDAELDTCLFGGGGLLTCNETVACFIECEEDAECQASCFDRASGRALELLDAYLECTERTACGETGRCPEACRAERDACAHDASS